MVDEEIKKFNDALKEDTESHLKDKLYNWLVDVHTRKGKKFTFSDRVVWKGAIYTIPELASYMIFFALFYFLGNIVYDKYGWPRLFMLFMLLILWRLNMAVKYLRKINTKLGE
jgi:hypothetical protein